MYLLDGEPISADMQFESNGVSYPAGWIRAATPEEQAAAGIVWIADEPMPDPFYAHVSADPDEPWKWVSVPLSADEMKSRLEGYSKQRRDMRMNGGVEHTIGATTYLVPTDYITRHEFFSFRIIQERPGSPTVTPVALRVKEVDPLSQKEVVVALTEAQLLGVEVKMEQRVHGCYSMQLTLQQGIQDESITTKEQIDAAYASVA